ncbi:MAG TPA: hemerythrin domain-containing protein [Egibacteraceae bacterium]|jgi:hemerythrin-like domain-containing protein|nr:hemerythrin domain-containing protein [Egibacteraceae bacterium]
MSETSTTGADAANSGDVIDLIRADHREFERLFGLLRDRGEDRASRLRELADLLVAHALAEESEVYPKLRLHAPEEREEIEHSVEEHAEGNEALARLQMVSDVTSRQFDQALDELVEAVTHHIEEEERDVLEPARESVPERTRYEIGGAFMTARLGWLKTGAGAPEKVRDLLGEYRDRGLV